MKAKIIGIMNFKGGVAKTTTTSNLAAALALKNKKVLIVDMDPQGQAGMHFGIKSIGKESIYHAIKNLSNIEDVIVKLSEAHKNVSRFNALANIDIILGSWELTNLERDIKYSYDMLKKTLSSVTDKYDYILIESNPSSRALHDLMFHACSHLIIPFIPDTLSVDGTIKFIMQVNTIRKEHRLSNLKIFGLLPSLVKESTKVHISVLESFKKYCINNNLKVLNNIPYSISNLTSITVKYVPIVLSSNNALANSFTELSNKILKEI